MAELTRYDRIPYSNHPYRQAHPDQLAVTAALHGLVPPPPSAARVLELGCGAGGHLIGIGYAYPEVRAVGVDLAPTAIERARAEAGAVGLSNVEFDVGDVRELVDGRLGTFDYVIAHGIFSWVPEDARAALPEAVRSHLAPDGLAYVSFNAHPGGHLRAILRDACAFHARDATSDAERVALGREMLELLLRFRATDDVHDPYGRFLADVLPRLLEADEGQLSHDLLGPDEQPFWYAEFTERFGRHGLEPVGESRLAEPTLLPRGPEVREAIDGLAADDRVAREQLVDLFGRGRFRETVLAHAPANARAKPDPDALRRLHFMAPGVPEHLPEGPLRALVAAAAGELPLAASFARMAEASGLAEADLHEGLLEAMRTGLVGAWFEPPRAVPAGSRPRASALARAQARRGHPSTTLLHTVIVVDGPGAALLDLLDGSRDAAAIARDLRAKTGIELPEAVVVDNLRELGAAGLLEEAP